MARRFNRWLSSKAGMRTLAGILAVVIVVVVAGALLGWWAAILDLLRGTAAPPGGYTCLPAPCNFSEEDAKFFSLPGEDMASFGGEEIVVWITVPGDWSSFELGFFDGDSGKDNAGTVNKRGGNWDNTETETTYILYADPLKTGGGKEVRRWSDREMSNNAWYDATINTGGEAKSQSTGVYVYRLLCQRPIQGHGINAFKLRSTAYLSTGRADLVNANFAIVGMLGQQNDIPILFPNYQSFYNPGTSRYTGDWQFFFDVPADTVYLEVWDGDFDRGTSAMESPDTDDPNTEGTPSWANPAAVDEGVGGRLWGLDGKGLPADNYAWAQYRIGDPVWYQIVDPAGDPIYTNGEPGNPNEPSGTEEWERYALTTDPGTYPVPGVADEVASRLLAGVYRWDIHGLDLHNTVWIRTDYEVCPPCPDEACCPEDDCQGSCPRTIGYWKNNVYKVLIKDKSAQETAASLKSALEIVAMYSPLYRSGINVAAPAPIDAAVRLTNQEANAILQKEAGNTMLDRALQQNLATWLNMASGKICPDTYIVVNAPSGVFEGTVWQALQYTQDIIFYHRDDATLLEQAKDIADMINNAQINVDPEELTCDDYVEVIPPGKQPKPIHELPKASKRPEPPGPVVGCDSPRMNGYGVEVTDNPFYGIKFNYQSGTEIKDGLFDEFRFTLPTAVVEGMTSIQLEAKAGENVGQATLQGCVFSLFTPCETTVTDGNRFFTFTFQGAVPNDDDTMTLIFHVQNHTGSGLSHATFGLPAGEVPSSPTGSYQSEVCP